MQTLVDSTAVTQDRRRKQQELSQRYGQITPGSQAEADLVQDSLPLVKSVVGRIAMTLPPHVDAEDLYSAGMVGLLSAVRQYDPEGGSTFESYARVRIRGSVFDELRRMDWVPRSIHDKARKVQQTLQALEQSKGEVPNSQEMAAAMKLTLSEYESLLEEIRPATFICLDSVQYGGADGEGEASRYESVADESQENPVEATARRELAGVIAERLEHLPEIQRKVLAFYYFEGLRLREIAEVFGVTESRICQIHAQAIMAIKAYLQKHNALES